MALKEVTHTEQVLVCDSCGFEGDITKSRHMEKCSVCGADVCSQCFARITFTRRADAPNNDYLTYAEHIICQSHLPYQLFKH